MIRSIHSRRAHTRLYLACTAVISSGIFALWPVHQRHILVPTLDHALEPAHSPAQALSSLDLAAFRLPIWVAEAPPPPAPAPAPPPPMPAPLKIQLLAIIRESKPGTYRAAVYDPDTDRVLVVAAGERIGSRAVERVDRASLTLSDQHGSRVLALKDGAP